MKTFSLTIQKFEGKGGWTYVVVPVENLPKSKTPFGWLEVKAKVDNLNLGFCKLMPMKNGALFLPLKKSILKALSKQVGDSVVVEIVINGIEELTEEILKSCMEPYSGVWEKFIQRYDIDSVLSELNLIQSEAKRDLAILTYIHLLETL